MSTKKSRIKVYVVNMEKKNATYKKIEDKRR